MQTFHDSDTACGFTLVELVLVLVIVAVLAGLVAPQIGGAVERAETGATQASMRTVQDAIESYLADHGELPRPDPGLLTGSRLDTPQLRYLFVNPASETPEPSFDPSSATGWRGPYLKQKIDSFYLTDSEATSRGEPERLGFTAQYGLDDDPAVLDGWSLPLVIVSEDVTYASGAVWRIYYLESAGPDGELAPPPNLEDDLRVEIHRERQS